MSVTDHKWLDPNCDESGCQSLVLKDMHQKLILALAMRSKQTCYAGDPDRFVDAVINNLDEVDAILPDSLNRSLPERISLLLERANKEAALAVELRAEKERAEVRVHDLEAGLRRLYGVCKFTEPHENLKEQWESRMAEASRLLGEEKEQ